MTESSASTSPDFDDDAPDLSAPYWQERIAKVPVQRGRPRALAPKQATTLPLSAEVLDHFQAGGPGWQARIDEALLKVVRGG